MNVGIAGGTAMPVKGMRPISEGPPQAPWATDDIDLNAKYVVLHMAIGAFEQGRVVPALALCGGWRVDENGKQVPVMAEEEAKANIERHIRLGSIRMANGFEAQQQTVTLPNTQANPQAAHSYEQELARLRTECQRLSFKNDQLMAENHNLKALTVAQPVPQGNDEQWRKLCAEKDALIEDLQKARQDATAQVAKLQADVAKLQEATAGKDARGRK